MTDDHQSKAVSSVGTVFLIGAGPGDPCLITIKGREKIRQADVVVYDYLAANDLLGEARTDAELIYVGKKGRDHTCEQPDINELLVTKAREGKNVARLKGGDPFVFGRGGEEAEDLADAGIPFEVVPGVTSAVAAPAYAGIPVTHRDHASMVTFITGHEDPTKSESAIDWKVLASNPGTLVFLMGAKNLPNISESLIKHGKSPSTPAALVRWGTTSRQISLTSTLAGMPEAARAKGIKAPAIFIVGSVSRLHERLNWFETKPLFSKKVLITRARKQSRRMADKIAELGGEPILFPTIEIQPTNDYGPLDKAIQQINSYDWIIFTSVNGVELFFDRFFELRQDIREMAGPRIGAIGPVTSSTIKSRGLKVDLLAKEFVAEGVLAQLSENDAKGKRFLIPRAAKARDILPDEIAKMGGIVDVVPVYQTVMPESSDVEIVLEMFKQKDINAVTFTSSSTVTHFIRMFESQDLAGLMNSVVCASIGPITSKTLKDNGLEPTVEATEYTIDGLVQALVRHFHG